MAAFTIVELAAWETHDLRLRILRQGTPSSDVTYPEDELPGTFHLGALLDGALVGTSSWADEPWPESPSTPAMRLRGMAVEPDLQGTGCGAALVAAGVDRAVSSGARLLWATARDTVLPFYERCGFAVAGDGFIDEATALPHHAVVRPL